MSKGFNPSQVRFKHVLRPGNDWLIALFQSLTGAIQTWTDGF